MTYRLLSEQECIEEKSGAAITVTTIMTILCTAIIAVVVYKLFTSKKGTTTVPGGWKFTWN